MDGDMLIVLLVAALAWLLLVLAWFDI